MTLAWNSPALAFADIDAAVRGLRARGMRVSAPRRLLLEALFAAEGPVSAELLARRLKLDPASVYRNMDTFEREGLVRHVHLGHGPGLYVLASEGEHAYLYCEGCGAVRALTPAELAPLRRQLRARFGYDAHFEHHAIVGTCERCRAEQADADTAAPSQKRPQTRAHGHQHGQEHARANGQQTRAGQPAPGRGHAHQHGHGDRIHAHPHEH